MPVQYIVMQDKSIYFKALKEMKKAVAAVGPARRFLKALGLIKLDSELDSFCKAQGYTLIENVEDIKALLLYLDKRTEAVERVLARYGLTLIITFNLRFLEDWSHLCPTTPDNMDDKEKEEWNWGTLEQQVIEFFHAEYQKPLYEVIGIRFSVPEICGWIRQLLGSTDGETWWKENIFQMDYTTDA